MSLCQYNNIFGKPNKGIHSHRLFGFAIVDILATLILAYIISKYTSYKLIYCVIFTILLGIIIHKIFCVKTKLNYILSI